MHIWWCFDYLDIDRPGISTGPQILSHYLHEHKNKAYGQKLADFQVLISLGHIFNAEDMYVIDLVSAVHRVVLSRRELTVAVSVALSGPQFVVSSSINLPYH